MVLTDPTAASLLLCLGSAMLASLLWLTVPLGFRELLDAWFLKRVTGALLNQPLPLALLGIFLCRAFLDSRGSNILEWIGERIG